MDTNAPFYYTQNYQASRRAALYIESRKPQAEASKLNSELRADFIDASHAIGTIKLIVSSLVDDGRVTNRIIRTPSTFHVAMDLLQPQTPSGTVFESVYADLKYQGLPMNAIKGVDLIEESQQQELSEYLETDFVVIDGRADEPEGVVFGYPLDDLQPISIPIDVIIMDNERIAVTAARIPLYFPVSD